MKNPNFPLTFVLSATTPRRPCGSIYDIFEWLRQAEFRAVGRDTEGVEFGVIIGEDQPSVDFRGLPWIDTSGDPITLKVFRGGRYQPVGPHVLGELKTRARLANTVEEEIGDGWVLADENNPFGASVDLRQRAGFFVGTAPNWDVYTAVFIGYGKS